MMSITNTFLMITHRDIIHDKPYCKGIITYTAPKMNLQKVRHYAKLEVRLAQIKKVIVLMAYFLLSDH